MTDREDIGTPTEEAASLLDGSPRDGDVAGEITRNTKRVWLIGAGALLVVALGAWGVLALVDGGDASDDGSGDTGDVVAEDAEGTPASSGDESGDDQAPDPDTDDSEATTVDGESGDADDDPDAPAPCVDAGMVAFRMTDDIWVANEDGSDARYVAHCADGEYALSLDGTALAVWDAVDGSLRIVDVESGDQVLATWGNTTGDLAWSTDCRRLYFTKSTLPSLWSVDKEMSGQPVMEGTGLDPVPGPVTPSLLCAQERSDGKTVLRMTDGSVGGTSLELPWRVGDYDWDGEIIVYSLAITTEHDAAIRVGTVEDVEGARLLGAPTSPGFMVGYGEVLLSPDSRWIAYTAAGDDGYSRLFTIPTAGGTSRELSTRRDAYPVRWSSDGEYLLFIEGNAWHGEDTRLLRVRPDGTGRQTLVEGAGL